MPRVLHVLSEDLSSGTAKQVELLCAGLAQRDWHSSVCSLEHDRARRSRLPLFADTGGTSQLSFCPSNSALDLPFIVQYASRLRVEAPDIVHLWGSHSRVTSFLSNVLLRNTTVVASARSQGEADRLLQCHSTWLPRVDAVTTNQAGLADWIAARTRNAIQPVVIPNGVEGLEQPQSQRESDLQHPDCRTDLKSLLNLSDETLLIGVVGDLRSKKRIRDLIWTQDLLRVLVPQMQMIVIGSGLQAARLQKFSRDIDSQHCVHFLGRRHDIPDLLKQCFCFWQASEDEGCSNAMLEAMAMGVPVLASDTPGHRSIVTHEQNGILVRLSDYAELAKRTNMLVLDPGRAKSLGGAGQQFVRANFRVESMLRGYHDFYESIQQHSKAA